MVGFVCEVLQPIAGGAGQSSPGHNHVNRHPGHQFGEASFACERLHETLALQYWQHMCGDATGEVNTTGRQHLERKIACLIAKNRSKNVECGGAEYAGLGRIESELDDSRRRVACSGNGFCDLGRLQRITAAAKILVDVWNPDAGTHVLIAHVIEMLEHVCQQAHLCLISRRKAGMAAFGAVSNVTGSSIPGEE